MAEQAGERAESFDSLRTEIIEAQKARTDLIKYKLVVTAILGAVALGIGPASGSEDVASPVRLTYVVGLVPFVSLYVDAVCRHNDIRIMIIGRYLRLANSPYQQYERLVKTLRNRLYLERVALDLSTVSLSILILAVGLSRWIFGRDIDAVLTGIEVGSGSLGIIGSGALMYLRIK